MGVNFRRKVSGDLRVEGERAVGFAEGGLGGLGQCVERSQFGVGRAESAERTQFGADGPNVWNELERTQFGLRWTECVERTQFGLRWAECVERTQFR